MYNLLQSTRLDVNIYVLKYVAIVLIALVNVDRLVLQFDFTSSFRKGYIFMSQNNGIMK